MACSPPFGLHGLQAVVTYVMDGWPQKRSHFGNSQVKLDLQYGFIQNKVLGVMLLAFLVVANITPRLDLYNHKKRLLHVPTPNVEVSAACAYGLGTAR